MILFLIRQPRLRVKGELWMGDGQWAMDNEQ